MQRRQACRLLALATLLPLAPGVLLAQPSQVPLMTRLVKIFYDLESKLQQAQRDGDAATLKSLLADDFEQRQGARPGTPVPRADWLAAAKPDAAIAQGRIEQVAAHDHGPVVVVSFLVRPPAGTAVFVVDSWTKVGEHWKLAVRYSAPAA